MNESALIGRIVAGDRDAFRVLVIRYQRPVFRFLSTFRLTAAEREELAQEAFLRAYQNLASFDPGRGAAFSSWLFVIVKNLALNELARGRGPAEQWGDSEETVAATGFARTRLRLRSGHVHGDRQREQHPLPITGFTAAAPLAQDVVLELGQRRFSVQRALVDLPRAFRDAVALAYLDELSLEEIAAIEGCSVGTIKSRIFRGKKLLRRALALGGT